MIFNKKCTNNQDSLFKDFNCELRTNDCIAKFNLYCKSEAQRKKKSPLNRMIMIFAHKMIHGNIGGKSKQNEISKTVRNTRSQAGL